MPLSLSCYRNTENVGSQQPYRVIRKQAIFGKIITITDNTDWTMWEILEANLDRWQVGNRFRLYNDDELVASGVG